MSLDAFFKKGADKKAKKTKKEEAADVADNATLRDELGISSFAADITAERTAAPKPPLPTINASNTSGSAVVDSKSPWVATPAVPLSIIEDAVAPAPAATWKPKAVKDAAVKGDKFAVTIDEVAKAFEEGRDLPDTPASSSQTPSVNNNTSPLSSGALNRFPTTPTSSGTPYPAKSSGPATPSPKQQTSPEPEGAAATAPAKPSTSPGHDAAPSANALRQQ